MLDNGTCAIIMTTKTLVLMEVKVEILGETLKPLRGIKQKITH